jgi:hypothetical protein
MNARALVALAALVVVTLFMSSVSGQAPSSASGQDPQARAKGAGAWTVPRAIDGHPDLQGYWTNDTVTPLERPAEFGEKAVVTADDAEAYAK